jgi:hypothetical protein
VDRASLEGAHLGERVKAGRKARTGRGFWGQKLKARY